jgi:hypothetical protein
MIRSHPRTRMPVVRLQPGVRRSLLAATAPPKGNSSLWPYLRLELVDVPLFPLSRRARDRFGYGLEPSPTGHVPGLTRALAVRDRSTVPNVYRTKSAALPRRTLGHVARPLRAQFENAVYHVTSRGNRKQEIYADSADRRYFLQVLETNVERYGWLVHAYCQMTNHYHLLVQTPLANISAGMQRLNAMYAEWFNWRHRVSGHLLSRPVPLDARGNRRAVR